MIAPRRLYAPRPPPEFTLSRRHMAILAVLYGLAVVYSSLVLGPDGLHYVPISLGEAWQKFRALQFVDNASDQRADWIANAIMIVPLAYFLHGALTQGVPPVRQVRRAAGALSACIAIILMVKYAQLFFPPRTVTLNYIAAQSIGALLGVGLSHIAQRRIYPWVLAMHRGGHGLVIVLGAYSILAAAYFLMPFDIALSPDDLLTRLAQLPLSVFPGVGRNEAYRTFLVLADAAATVPVGMFLAVTGRELSFGGLILRGIGLIVPVTILSLFVLSTTPFAFCLVSRTVGVGIGIWFMWRLKGKDLWKRHYQYARYVPIAFPTLVALAMLSNGLLNMRWLSADQAIAGLASRQLLPLWSLYIVTKAEAARSVVETAAMFAPIGAMVWLRRGFWSKGARFSAFLAFAISLAIEIGRAAKPDIDPNFTAPFVAAVAAAAAFRVMPALWKLFEEEAKSSVLRDSYSAQLEQVPTIFDLQIDRENKPRERRRWSEPPLSDQRGSVE